VFSPPNRRQRVGGGDARSGPDQRTQPLYLIRDVVPPTAYPETAAPATRRAAGAALLSTTNTVQRPVPSSDAPAAAMGVMHLALQPPPGRRQKSPGKSRAGARKPLQTQMLTLWTYGSEDAPAAAQQPFRPSWQTSGNRSAPRRHSGE
jgi:hypothetical protein